MQGPTYGLETDITDKMTSGVLSNPMEHGEASKLALYGVADYNWNVADYNAIDNWERGLVDLTPEAHEAYRTFAIHSCDTETGYRRAESWETNTFRLADFSQKAYNDLYGEFDRVEKTKSTMERDCKNQLLMKELKPWLEQFELLGKRGKSTLKLMKTFRNGNAQNFWNAFVANRMTKEARAAYEKHKLGTMKLQPFYENAMDDMAQEFFKNLTGEVPAFYKGMGTYPTLATTQSKLMFDNDSTTYYHCGQSQSTGDWVGADLGAVRDVREVKILQGRNSVDDVDYFDNVVLETSEDGKSWTQLTGELLKTYIIHWKGEPVKARYVRIRKAVSEKKSWIAVREFMVNPTTPESLNFKVESADLDAAMFGFDKNPVTSFRNSGKTSFTVVPGTKAYTMLLNVESGNAVKFNQYDKKGKLLASTDINNSFFNVNLNNKAAKAEIEGNVEVFEVIAK